MTTRDSTIKYFHFTSANIVVKGLLTGLLYGFFVDMSTRFIFPLNHSPVIWSANALPVAVLLFNRNRQWPKILFFCLIGLLISKLPTSRHDLTPNLVLYSINLLEIYFLATIIRKVTGTSPTRRKLEFTVMTGLWAAAAAVIIFSIVVVLLFPLKEENTNFLEMVSRISTSAYLGQALLLSATLYWIVPGRVSFSRISRGKLIELALIWLILLGFTAITLISLKSRMPIYYDFPYVTFPLLVWAAIRFNIRLTVTFSIFTSVFTKYLASLGYLSFDATGLSPHLQITVMNIGLIALDISVLILAIIVSDYKQVKRDLTARDEWFQIAISHISGGLYLLNQERRFIIISAGLQKKINLPADIFCIGAHIEPVLRFRAARGDYGRGKVADLVRERLDKLEKKITTRGYNSVPDGHIYEYLENHTQDGEVIVIYHEITDRIKAEQDSKQALSEAHQANKAKTDFLANMSHELRTPLNAIIGFSDMITNDKSLKLPADKVREYCADINMSGLHLLRIINDILDLSKIEAGKADAEFLPIPLESSIRECVKFIELRAADVEITIFNDIKNTEAILVADKRMFKQIIINILSNSVKFTLRKGKIHISFDINKAGETIISIADTGIGIAEADLVTVMEPFHQVDSSLSRKVEGTGLGLPLVKSLMEIHGGTIVLKSTPGVGTTVLLTFPPHDNA